MPVGAGSIKRAAKLNAEGSKTAETKKVDAVEAKSEVTESQGTEEKVSESKTAVKKTTAKKATAKKTTEKVASEKTADTKKEFAKKSTKKVTTKTVAKAVSAMDNKNTGSDADLTAPKRLGSDPACHFTEEMPVYLL